MIECDIFERKSGVPAALHKLTPTKVVPLKVGDYKYTVPGGCEIIERKTITDFWKSRFEHRLQDQLYRIRDANCGATLLIELDKQSSGLLSLLLTNASTQAFFSSVQRQYGVRVMFSCDAQWSAKTIYWCYMNDQKLKHRSLAPKMVKSTSADTQAAAFAGCIPGIGKERGAELAAKYKSWYDITHEESPTALTTKQISDRLAKKVWDYLRTGNGKHTNHSA